MRQAYDYWQDQPGEGVFAETQIAQATVSQLQIFTKHKARTHAHTSTSVFTLCYQQVKPLDYPISNFKTRLTFHKGARPHYPTAPTMLIQQLPTCKHSKHKSLATHRCPHCILSTIIAATLHPSHGGKPACRTMQHRTVGQAKWFKPPLL